MSELQIGPSTGEKRPRPRIETLADLIFGLSLSIGSITLVTSPPSSISEIGSHAAAFGYTFLILITCWIIYTAFMSVLPVETNSITFLNVVLLLLVALGAFPAQQHGGYESRADHGSGWNHQGFCFKPVCS